MRKIGDYEYPNLSTFKDALSIAEDAVTKYGGIIPNIDTAKKLGYNVKSPSAISGTIYKRFDDVCAFGLTMRDRGGLKATPLAIDAVDPYDSRKAEEAKAKAVRSIKLISVAYDAWKGEVPRDDALPARVSQIASVPWTEAQRHSTTLKPLLTETFAYLRITPGKSAEASSGLARGSVEVHEMPRGELKTTTGSITITDLDTLSIAEQYLALLKKQLSTKRVEIQEKTKPSGKAQTTIRES